MAAPTRSHPLGVYPPLTLLHQEISTLTSSMRRNQRWASVSQHAFAASTPPLPHGGGRGLGMRSSSQGSGYGPGGGRRKASGSSLGKRSEGGGGPTGQGQGQGVDGEEGDLMLGFVALRRELGGAKGESGGRASM